MKSERPQSGKWNRTLKLMTSGCIIIIFLSISHAEKKYSPKKSEATSFSAGFQLHDFSDDFGGGINLTTPWFWNKRGALRLTQDIVFNDIKNWLPYSSTRLGLVGSSGLVHTFLRLYGEGGLQVLANNKKITSDMVSLSGYGHFGFEFFTNSESNYGSYYIELGSSGIGTRADKLEGKQLIFNGFCIGVGTRHYF